MVLTAGMYALFAPSPSTRDYMLEKLKEYCPQAFPCTAAWMAHGLPDAPPPEIPPSPCRGCPFSALRHPDPPVKTPSKVLPVSPRETLGQETYDKGIEIISQQSITQVNMAREMGTSRSNLQRRLKPFPGL
jgi:hypothetical protein